MQNPPSVMNGGTDLAKNKVQEFFLSRALVNIDKFIVRHRILQDVGRFSKD